MSNYENYSATARDYDTTRAASGVDIIADCLADCKTPLAQQHLLDAGCGTANYAHALRARVNSISAVDLNAAMLARARAKMAARGSINFYCASIDALPFADKVFDGAMLNQVLHHLELRAADGYPNYRRVFAELARVLKPGGALVVNTCARAQLRNGFWYYDLIPDARERMCARHAPLDALRDLICDAGFVWQKCIAPPEVLMQGDAYSNMRGPLNPDWRAGDSIWSTVRETELKHACARIRKLDAKDALPKYFREQDAARKSGGQLSFLYARRFL